MIPARRRPSLFGAILCSTGVAVLASIAFYHHNTGHLQFSRFAHIAVLLNDGNVLLAGGEVSGSYSISPEYCNILTTYSWIPTSWFYTDEQVLKSCEVFDSATGAWKRTVDLVYGNPSSGLLLNSGKVFVGGFHPQIYDPRIGKWEIAPDSTRLVDLIRQPGAKRLLENGINSFSATIVDLSTGNWARLDTGNREKHADSFFVEHSTGSMNQARFDFTATLLKDGRVLVAGGAQRGSIGPGYHELNSCELYDPTTGKWALLP